MTTKEKVLQYIDFKKINKMTFYNKTGLSNGFLNSGKNIGSNNLKVIIENYPDLNLEWLIMDKGDMILRDNNLNNPLTTDLIETQKDLIKYKDDEIKKLKLEIETLKKSITINNNKENIVKQTVK